VARAVAPVKPAFLRPPPVREVPKEEGKAGGGWAVIGGEEVQARAAAGNRCGSWVLELQCVIELCLLAVC
jgi:hypothetical protein